MDVRLYWVWLQRALGAGSGVYGRLLREYERPEKIFAATHAQLERSGVPAKTLERLCDKSLDKVKEICRQATVHGDWMLTPDDSRYPELLRGLYDPPIVLYVRGDFPDFGVTPAFAFVGHRDCSPYGKRVTTRLSAVLSAAGMAIVSGGAVGIDRAAHEGAMQAGGPTVAVLPCGLDVDYLRQNEDMRRRIVRTGGALITEYPPGVPVLRGCFQVRNRLISGLSLGVCVVEAPAKSGSLITARTAREQGRDVFAVPADIHSSLSVGSHRLLRDGAHVASCAADILTEYTDRFGDLLDSEAALAMEAKRMDEQPAETPPASKIPPPVRGMSVRRQQAANMREEIPSTAPAPLRELPLTDNARKLLAVLTEQPQTADEISQNAELPAGLLLSALTELEIAGRVCRYPGKRYARVSEGMQSLETE